MLCLACLFSGTCRAAVLPAIASSAGQYLVDHWTTTDGLPVNGVNKVLLARSGYLWLATFDGLVRFDGHRFSVFRAGLDNPGLPGNRIIELVETPDGQLWLRTEAGRLVRFDGHAFHTIGSADGLSDAQVDYMQLDASGILWVGTRTLVARRLADNRFAVLPGSRQLGLIHGLWASAKHTLWVATDTGIAEFKHGRLQRRLGAGDGIPLPAVSVAQDRLGHLWVVGTKRVVREDANGRFQPVLGVPGNSHIVAQGARMAIDAGFDTFTVEADGTVERRKRGALFGGTQLATLVRHGSDGSIWRNALDRLERDGRVVFKSPCTISDFAFGNAGSIWVVTACSGLYELRPRHIFAISKLDGIPLGGVYSLAQATDGTLWISTRSHGVAIVAPTGSVTWRQYGLKADPGKGLLVVSIGAGGETWVGSCRVMAPGDCRTPANWPVTLGVGGSAQAIQRARDGSLWVGGNGLWRESAAGQWQDWTARSGLDSGAEDARVRALLEADDGSLWFATLGDGVLWRAPDGRFRRFTVADGLASNSIRAVRLDRRKQLWIATQDRGLCRMRMQAAESLTPHIACIDHTRGLWSDSLHQILFDDQGRMWLNSNNGIFAMSVAAVDAVLDGRAGRVYPQVYTEHDGLPSREGNGGVDHAGIKLADGRMAFPTADGVAIFNPRDLSSPRGQVRAVFERLSLPDGKSIVATGDMTLARGIRGFTVQFTGLAPQLTAPTYFRYRVVPDKAWIDVGSARQISLSRLSPGTQTLELVALGSNGKAGPASRITLNLPPYWYETTAFRSIAPLLGLLAVLWWFWHLRRVGLARQRQLERRVDERTTELHGALDTIERLAMSKTRFFANVSHELRTPLALLIGPIDDYARGHAPSKKLLGAMQRNAHRLERLIGQLLDLERIDARRFPLRPQTLDLAALAQESVTAFEPLALREKIDFVARLPDHPMPVRGDDEQLMRVIGNLLSNALKFCPEGGRVEVALDYAPDQTVCLRVDDSGPGITADWRTRIFDRFSQMGSDATRSREGAGLGLALCREVAELHGGRLYASDSPLGGAGFVFELPPPTRSPLAERVEDANANVTATRADPTGEADQAPAATYAQTPQQSSASDDDARDDTGDDASGTAVRPLVLLAEDNPDLRHYLSAILAEHYRVIVAADGAIALQRARAELPDLVVTDLMMPNLDGIGLAHALRVDTELAGVPIIFLTARAADADQIAGLDGGADYYLTKPFDSRVLLAQLGAALRACQRLRARYAQRAQTAESSAPSALGIDAAAPNKTAFALRLEAQFEAHAHDPEFGIAAMCNALHLSETALRRHCRDECLARPGELLRRHRLTRAHALLIAGAGNVSEIAYGSGYTSLSAFSRAYRDHYGHPPSLRAV